MRLSLRILIAAGLVAVVAAWRSAGELRFAWEGVEAVGRPIAVQRELRRAGGEPTGRFRVQFVFAAGPAAIEGAVLVNEAEMEAMQTAGRIPLLYLPGEPARHAVRGHRALAWPLALAAALLVAAGCGLHLGLARLRTRRPAGA